NFCSNNYLSLADSIHLRRAAVRGIKRYGVGAGAARLVAGNLCPHAELERELARWTRAQAALLFNSGYQANIGIIPCLVGAEDLILSDALNHASIIDGCRLSRAHILIYRHRDLEHLGSLLLAEAGKHRRV